MPIIQNKPSKRIHLLNKLSTYQAGSDKLECDPPVKPQAASCHLHDIIEKPVGAIDPVDGNDLSRATGQVKCWSCVRDRYTKDSVVACGSQMQE